LIKNKIKNTLRHTGRCLLRAIPGTTEMFDSIRCNLRCWLSHRCFKLVHVYIIVLARDPASYERPLLSRTVSVVVSVHRQTVCPQHGLSQYRQCPRYAPVA